ncbi:hypothetical protein pqer_cds_97 [Pandoravirus quercus]|uniref:DUF3592 domain-containing protein n=2 Tax=Pandoravirus TaxID=2060084 RepID=A0A2U7U7X3_9VIRU|nr:hypothetical protein pqer_cds_97 [Pandoravirus quercus]AVK74519.1 hypothetical protein pqer_cds_97 [Pandoravirus quercus]QBZ80701.1 hypothetical protein pclt_cds_103 [Pandoravirus celtis]
MGSDRRHRAIECWPCWTVAPALVVAVVVFVPWYAWHLAPGYAMLDRVEPASCLVLAHNASTMLGRGAARGYAGVVLNVPRLWVRFRVGDAVDPIETWARPYLTDADSRTDADGAAAFFARFPTGTSAPCYYDPEAPVDHVAMHDNLPSLGRGLFLTAWCAACAAVCSVAVSFSVVSRWAGLDVF